MKYVDVLCVVDGGSVHSCQRDGQILVTPSTDVTVGYLASTSTTDHGGIGSNACPWRMQVIFAHAEVTKQVFHLSTNSRGVFLKRETHWRNAEACVNFLLV